MPRLKVCGINDAAFAVEAARRGVDFLGFIFAPGSPRRVSPGAAKEIADLVRAVISFPSKPRFVGVFTSHSAEEIAEIADFARLDVVQLHSRDYGADEIKFLKAKVGEVWVLHGGEAGAEDSGGTDDGRRCAADAVLLDGSDGKRSGGTGMRADWSLVAGLKAEGRRVVLAGGISAENIAAATATGADVIDVNSSLETSPGVKSASSLDLLLKEFAQSSAVRRYGVRPA